jgi:hypothetical protein
MKNFACKNNTTNGKAVDRRASRVKNLAMVKFPGNLAQH